MYAGLPYLCITLSENCKRFTFTRVRYRAWVFPFSAVLKYDREGVSLPQENDVSFEVEAFVYPSLPHCLRTGADESSLNVA